MVAYLDYTSPKTQFTFDVNKSRSFTKDKHNFINILGIKQLNTLENISLLDIFLSKIQPNTFIGPHKNCKRKKYENDQTRSTRQNPNYIHHYHHYPYNYPFASYSPSLS